MGRFYQRQFLEAAQDPARSPLLMTRAVLETLYGGGFHPGVELTWPMRHNQMYAENRRIYELVNEGKELSYGIYGLWEVRINAASPERKKRFSTMILDLKWFPMTSRNLLTHPIPSIGSGKPLLET